jgi:senataxin
MLSCHRKSRKEKSGKNLQAARQTFEVHAAVVTDVAFAKAYNGGEWADSRTYARLLLRNILQADAEDTKESIIQVSKLRDSNLKTSKSPPEIMPLQPLSVHSQLWRKSYDTLGKDDPDGIALLIGPVAASAYFDALRAGDSGAFADGKVKAEVRQEFGLGVTAINRALNSMRGGFLTAVERFTEHATSATVRDLFRQPDVVANIMRLMLSPVDQLNEASKALPLSAYEEVGERSECFRIFLEKFPEYSFSGIISYLETFNTYTAVVPEACTAAKSLVRCLTDVLEALCGKADGLLIDETFGREGNISLSVWLPKLWRKMTDGLSIIFKRTQAWSRFYSNEEMVDWMRDALIFGRDLVAQVSLLQSVSAGTLGLSVMASPRKLSRVEALLVENLYSVLAELISWLKLTDDETLHQSFELLKSLLKHFADSGSSPPEEVIQKLEDHARRKPGTKTQLTDGKLSELLIALSPLSKTIDISTLQIAEAAGSSDDDIVYLGTSTTLPDSKAMHLNAWDQAKKSSTSIKGYKQAEGKNIESVCPISLLKLGLHLTYSPPANQSSATHCLCFQGSQAEYHCAREQTPGCEGVSATGDSEEVYCRRSRQNHRSSKDAWGFCSSSAANATGVVTKGNNNRTSR